MKVVILDMAGGSNAEISGMFGYGRNAQSEERNVFNITKSS
jgi:hypothetical protein